MSKISLEDILPVDSAVRIGKLDNGLTYYIRHNDFLPNRADFYIAQKVGSILEEPNERGLAHFLEHMAFNGTEHFPGKSMINFLEFNGVKFGSHINAYTSVDETVYNLNNVPVENPLTVDTCIMILRDWSSGILLQESEIDKERGVIESEWRTRDDASLRMFTQIARDVYGTDKYADCMPIGSMDVVRNFPPEVLRNYYKKWYRPELQGLVIVGDIDVDQVEKTIQKAFADIQTPAEAKERIEYPVSSNQEPIVVFSTDKENAYGGIQLYQKVPSICQGKEVTVQEMQEIYMRIFKADIMNERLGTLLDKPNAPFSYAGASYSSLLLSKKQKAWNLATRGKSQDLLGMLKAILTENERMIQYGVTEAELKRAKAAHLSAERSAYQSRNSRENKVFVSEYVNNFLNNEPIPGIEYEYQLTKNLCKTITLEKMNQMVMQKDTTNQVVWLYGIEGTQFPSKNEVLQVIDSIQHTDFAVPVEEVLPTTLIDSTSLPAKGKILRKKCQNDGIYDYELSNGLHVQFKPFDKKKNTLFLFASRFGGGLTLSKEDQLALPMASSMDMILGLGEFTQDQLSKFLADKQAQVATRCSVILDNVAGSAMIDDVETMFQLLYLKFTALKDDTASFQSAKQRMTVVLEHQELDPETILSDTICEFLYDNHPLERRFTSEQLKKADYNQCKRIFQDKFSNAQNFEWVLVGDITPEQLEPLLEQYIATLPVAKLKRATGNSTLSKESKKKTFDLKMENPKSNVLVEYDVWGKLSLKEIVMADLLKNILDLVYFEKVREDYGGTYGVSAASGYFPFPEPVYKLSIGFETQASMVPVLTPIIYQELENIAQNGPREQDLMKTKEHYRKIIPDKLQNTKFWSNLIMTRTLFKIDKYIPFIDVMEKVTAKDLQKFVQHILKKGVHKELIQYGIPNK